VFLLTGGCGPGPKPRFTKEELDSMPFPRETALPQSSGGFVLAVGNRTISANEMVLYFLEDLRPTAQSSTFEQFEEQAREQVEQVVTTKILNLLLYREARKHAEEGTMESVEKIAEAEMKNFYARFGGDLAKANEALKRMRMNQQSYKEYLRMTILIQSYTASKVPANVPITYSELADYYNRMKGEFFSRPATIKFRLLDIIIDELEMSGPNQDRQQFATNEARKLVQLLQAGEDPKDLERKDAGITFVDHSDGIRPESLREIYDVLVVEAESMSPGETRIVPSTTGERIFVMMLVGKEQEGYKPLEEVQKQVEERIIADRQQKAVDELQAKLLQEVPITERDAFVDFCLKKIYRMSNQQAAES
jgi:hypothetical protein